MTSLSPGQWQHWGPTSGFAVSSRSCQFDRVRTCLPNRVRNSMPQLRFVSLQLGTEMFVLELTQLSRITMLNPTGER